MKKPAIYITFFPYQKFVTDREYLLTVLLSIPFDKLPCSGITKAATDAVVDGRELEELGEVTDAAASKFCCCCCCIIIFMLL